MKKSIFLAILLAGIYSMSSVFGDKSYKEPIFEVEYSAFNVSVEFRLNDIPIVDYSGEGVTSSRRPVPEYIVDGENVLSVRLRPLSEEGYPGDAYADARIVVRDKGDPMDRNEVLLHLRVEPAKAKSDIASSSSENLGGHVNVVKHEEDEIVVQRGVAVDSPFPRWAWQDGAVIEKNEKNLNSLLEKYKEIYAALDGEDMNRTKELYSSAAREYAEAYHYDDPDQGHRIMNTGGMFGKTDWKLGNINTLIKKGMKFQLDVYANGKLARLLNERGEEAILVYINPNTGLYSDQKFAFYKNNDNEWVMIR